MSCYSEHRDLHVLTHSFHTRRASDLVKIQLLVGARLVSADGPELLGFPTDRAAYGRLCRLLTLGKRRAEKGNCLFSFEEIIEHGAGQVFVLLPPENESIETESALLRLAAAFPNNVFLGAGALYQGDDHRSEEHTSELQSLMRHSYAVFCLKTNT